MSQRSPTLLSPITIGKASHPSLCNEFIFSFEKLWDTLPNRAMEGLPPLRVSILCTFSSSRTFWHSISGALERETPSMITREGRKGGSKHEREREGLWRSCRIDEVESWHIIMLPAGTGARAQFAGHYFFRLIGHVRKLIGMDAFWALWLGLVCSRKGVFCWVVSDD